MDERKTATETTVEIEGNLPDVVASLEMLTVTSTTCENESLGRKKMVLRTRIRKPENSEIRNRRCSLRPKKRTASEMESEDDVKEYYLNKSVKKKANNLETIFEVSDEDVNDDGAILMSSKRFKRMIKFQSEPTDAKIKKRRAKVKRIFGSKFLTKHRQSSMQTLINKLNVIRTESLIRISDETHKISLPPFNPYDAVRRCGVRQ